MDVNRKLRVAQVSPLFESVPPKLYGGTERVVDNLTRGLIEAGVDVTVFCSGDSTISAPKVEVWPEALRLSPRKILDPFAYCVRTLGYVFKYEKQFDLIHNHYDYPLLALSRMVRAPFISTIHNRMDQPDLSPAFEPFSDVPLVSISDAQRIPLPQLNWVKTIFHGIDLKTFEFHPKPGSYLAFLGRISRDKRPDWAIQIAKQSGIPLKIAAKLDHADLDYYETHIKREIDGKFIEYIGEISEHEKSEFLGQALALAFPIDWPEPFGLVMIEAMACGTPVLTRPMGSVPEIMHDGKTGFVRAHIRELAHLAEQTEKLDRSWIRQYVEKKFSIERMTQEYLNVYRQLLASNWQNAA